MKRDALVDSAQSALGWFEDHKSETILFAVVLALSNLPAPVLCLGCLGNPAICRSRVFLFGEIA